MLLTCVANFAQLLSQLLEDAVGWKCSKKVVQGCHCSCAMQVLLVGGGTRMPAFRRFVLNMTGLEPATFVQPDEASCLTVYPHHASCSYSCTCVTDQCKASWLHGGATP